MAGLVQFKVDTSSFSNWIRERASIAGQTMREAFGTEGRLLSYELIRWTPPFSGKTIRKMSEARGALYNPDPEVEDLTAKAMGERRVELDIRKVIYGIKGAQMPETQIASSMARIDARIHKSQNVEPVIDWGILQKCEGKEAVRIFATKSGEVYGIDRQRFMPDASFSDLEATHREHRTARGRVTQAGERDRVIGRWRWINALVTKAATVNAYIESKKKMVGQAKGGWADGFMSLGGRMSARGWIGRHRKAGRCTHNLDSAEARHGNVHIIIENHSAWAAGGDPDRVMEKATQGRIVRLQKDIQRRLEKSWGSKFRRSQEPLKQAA